MSTQGKYHSVTIVASNDFSAAHLDKAVTAGGLVAADADAIGLLKSKPGLSEHARVGVIGEMRYVAGAAITLGAKLTVTTSGFIVSTGSASGTTVGKALEAASSGDLARGFFNFANAGTLT